MGCMDGAVKWNWDHGFGGKWSTGHCFEDLYKTKEIRRAGFTAVEDGRLTQTMATYMKP